MTSTHLLEDMELINLVMKTKRPDGKPNAPIWITTEESEVSFIVIFGQNYLFFLVLLLMIPTLILKFSLDKYV